MTEPMFYCTPLPEIGATASLSEEESRHVSASRRLKPGDTLWLFDGNGNLAHATLNAGSGRTLSAVVTRREQRPAPAPSLHLACALPKGDRAASLMDMATQLGMASFTPLLCERSVVDPSTGSLERLRRICLEACKQSRRAHVPVIHAPATLANVLEGGQAKWIADPNGSAIGKLLPISQPLTVLIGPEGGFTPAELETATRHGAVFVALGTGILRIEAAAIALTSAIMLASV
jgi:16S rRNA (uracil1498-N3)-methyltransferase